MRQIALVCTVAIIALGSMPSQAQTAARAVPLSETVHGITLQDEYRWMEDPANKAEMATWVSSEAQRTRAMLDAMPQTAAFAATIQSTSSSLTRQGGYQRAAMTEIWSRVLPGEQTGKLVVRDKAGTRVLVDPATVTGNPLTTMGAFQLSPDGKVVAVQLSDGGSEIGSVHFIDTMTGKERYPAIPRIWGEGSATFLPGGLIAYNQLSEKVIDGDPQKGTMAYIRPLVGGTPIKVLGGDTGGADINLSEFPIVVDSAVGPYVLGLGAGARADWNLFFAQRGQLLAGKPQWHRVASLEDRVNAATLVGNALYLLTSKSNSSKDLVVRRFDAKGVLGPAKILKAGSENLILGDIAGTRDGLYLTASTDGVMRLFFAPTGSALLREVKLPFEGTGSMAAQPDFSGITIGLSGWNRNFTSYRVLNGKLIETGVEGSVWSGAKDLAVERYDAISADGTHVPLVVTRLKSSTGRVPTLVEAYGGYGIDSSTPFYNRNGMAFIAKGGAMAYCGVRGGGERGRAWHEAGRGHNKPRGQEDLIACARTLTAKGVAPVQGPVAIGSSMAGALVPGAALRDPGAFGGLVTRVGIVNATRVGAAENGANQFDEVGNPADPAQFADLLAMDAYQMIPNAKGLPPTMMVIGMNDHRVAPWMTAKFVARAQARWPGAPVWLRSDDKAGHGIGSTETVRRGEWSDIFAFAWANQQPK